MDGTWTCPQAETNTTQYYECGCDPCQCNPCNCAQPQVVNTPDCTQCQVQTYNAGVDLSRFRNSSRWKVAIDPRAQAWAQGEANQLARRGLRGYKRNGHPGGNNPYARMTGTGYNWGNNLIPTCEAGLGATLVAAAYATGNDGYTYGVRSWDSAGGRQVAQNVGRAVANLRPLQRIGQAIRNVGQRLRGRFRR